MIHIIDIYELKAKIHKLKHQLDNEPNWQHEKDLANKYLNKVLELVDELK